MVDPLGPAVRALVAGRLVLYPTDTLFGLGVRADRPEAIARLLVAKRRPPGQPISVAVSSTEEIEPLARLSEEARRFVRAKLPGPYTVLVEARPGAPLAPGLIASDGSIGIRVPDHPVARELARRAGPITATSANRHGSPPAATLAALRAEFGPEISAYVGLGPSPAGTPSSLVDLRGPSPRAVRRPAAGGRA